MQSKSMAQDNALWIKERVLTVSLIAFSGATPMS